MDSDRAAIRDSEMRLVVADRGFVRRQVVTSATGSGDETVRIRRVDEYSAPGETTVGRPDRLPAAANATGE